ncbi:sugar phosphate isomerase/epimerase family protein [Eudoraea chungangensis]|uniref:sugar phosphate isomerase/epimerase family protein n=1 Tax=Eudoraea chungangensis TaxID=1481905 RepID=UPI0023EB9239|nr:sugar phosphate isomerase/epimerase family protein [Eudoraea chungangensis]
MPKLAVFPKAFMHALCKDGSMRIAEWIALAEPLQVSGLEWYAGFLEMQDRNKWNTLRRLAEQSGKTIPMLCCSPDFTHSDVAHRKKEVEKQKYWIEMSAEMGASYCRVLSGQRRPDLGIEEGISYAKDCIEECLPMAQQYGITLIIENHYKDDFWEYPEFAQKKDIFYQLVNQIRHPNFGVNYDPSNTFLAGEDPIDLLNLVVDRVVTMHASDRFLLSGSIEDLRREEIGVEGYAKRLSHGEIGKGLNDYDTIFKLLNGAGFNGWISVEDGVDGMDQLERSVLFLRQKIKLYWPEFK